MKIKMLKTARGSDRDEAGCAMPVRAYVEGHSYEVGSDLGKTLCDMESAVKMEKEKAPENKMQSAPENKKKKSKKK